MRNTGIVKRIEKMIREELQNLKLGVNDAQRVYEYRDEHFLDGSFDYFLKPI